jgi:hypothetical protein
VLFKLTPISEVVLLRLVHGTHRDDIDALNDHYKNRTKASVPMTNAIGYTIVGYVFGKKELLITS